MLAAILIIIGLILLVFVHELGHFIAAKQAGMKVEEFGFGFPPRIVAWKRGETEYSFNWLPFGGFVRIYGESRRRLVELAQETGEKIEEGRAFYAQTLWKRFVTVAAGISINFIVGWLLLSIVFMIGAREAVIITGIEEQSPAHTIGLERGDEIQGYASTDEFIAFTHNKQGQEVAFTVLRDGVPVAIQVKLRKATEDQAPLGAGVSGVGFAPMGIFPALLKGLTDSIDAVAEIFRAFFGLVGDLFSSASVPSNIVGPVGIFGIAGDLGKLGFVYILQLIAMISLNLAALNVIPFPVLDGGRILFMCIEKVKGSPLHPKGEMWAHLVSFAFLILLMIVITGHDIARLF